MSRVFVSGMRTTIFEAFKAAAWEAGVGPQSFQGGVGDMSDVEWRPTDVPTNCERYFLAMGHLDPLRLREQRTSETAATLAVNLVAPMRIIDHVFQHNPTARICVIGSESGLRGSYNETYAAAKAALHRYVETKNCGQGQLVCIAPGMIEDSGMTERRADQENVARRAAEHPKGLLKAADVGAMAFHLLYVDSGYTTNVVIPMIGRPLC